MIFVVNKKTHKPTPYDVPVHRGTPLGNPASDKPSRFNVIFCKTRTKAIEYYKKWFRDQIEEKNEKVLAELRKIYKMSKAGDVNLVCYCWPEDCHGSVIKEFIEEKLYGSISQPPPSSN